MGIEKAQKVNVKITLKVTDDLEVINPVNIIGWSDYFVSPTENGERQLYKSFIRKGIEYDDLLTGANTMCKLRVINQNFPVIDEKKFYVKQVQYCKDK